MVQATKRKPQGKPKRDRHKKSAPGHRPEGQTAARGLGRRVALVYNSHSNVWLKRAGRQDPEQFLQQLLTPLQQEYGLEVELIAFDPATLESLPERLHKQGVGAIWAAGGDGTVLALAPLARQLDLPLGVLPAGTINLLARDLGMSLELETAVRQLIEARPIKIDMAELNGHHFLCMSNIGLATRFTQIREQKRHSWAVVRWPAVAWNVLRALFTYPNLHVEIKANGKRWKVKTRAISISNNPLCDDGGWLPFRERLDTGELAIYVTRENSVFSLPRLYSRLHRGNWQHDPDLLVIRTDCATFHFPHQRRLRVMHDGELIKLTTPLRYEIQTCCLTFLKPEATP